MLEGVGKDGIHCMDLYTSDIQLPECPGLNTNNMVPILDLNVRMEW